MPNTHDTTASTSLKIEKESQVGLRELALFAGAGGGILGGKLLGWTTVCTVEWDDHARRVLMARQDDGCLPAFPIWDDVQTFDGKPWAGLVDVVSGGFPCQDISSAGRGAGIDGERSGMWKHMARIIGEVRPRYVFVENSPMLTSRGLGRVLGDLAALGYDAKWGVLGAVHAGAPHKRERIWILAHAARISEREPADQANAVAARGEAWPEPVCGSEYTETMAHTYGLRKLQPKGPERAERRWPGDSGQEVADANCPRLQEQRSAVADGAEHEASECGGWWAAEPDVGRMAHGVASRVDRLRGLGNGQVPAVAALAWRTLIS